MKFKSTRYITLAICCILMFTGCGNKENAGNGIDMVTDGKLFRYKEFAFGDELSDIKENKELRSETDYHIVLKDDVTIFGISGGVVEVYSSPETNDCVTSVVVNYIYTNENAEKDSQATFDTLFDNLQKQVPSDCTTLDRRTGGNGALYIKRL